MKASNSKSQTEYIELADVVGVYLDVRHSIHSAYSPLVPHGVMELRCVPWHRCCKLPISMLHVAKRPNFDAACCRTVRSAPQPVLSLLSVQGSSDHHRLQAVRLHELC